MSWECSELSFRIVQHARVLCDAEATVNLGCWNELELFGCIQMMELIITNNSHPTGINLLLIAGYKWSEDREVILFCLHYLYVL